MRATYLILATLLLIALPCASQPTGWHVQQGGWRFLYAVDFPSADTGFVVGFQATALRTVNGGATWTQMSLPKSIVAPITLFVGVGFSSSLNGCLAYADTILHTTNAGISWSYASMDSRGSVGRFVFPTPTIGYAAGGSNGNNIGEAIMKTTDAGASWRHLSPPIDTPGVEYAGIDFRDGNNGMVITSHGSPSCYDLWRTTNGGLSWHAITANVIEPCSRNLSAITHVGGNTWVIGGNSIERTSDDGQTWTKVGIIPLPTAITFSDSLTGYATCSVKGAIFKTIDGGRHWYQQAVTADSAPSLIDISAPSSSRAFAIGQYYPTNGHDDVIVATSNGGGPLLSVDDANVPSGSMIQVFPNPAEVALSVNVVATTSNRAIRVVDCLGREVFAGEIQRGETLSVVPTSTFAAGLYWCVVGNRAVKFGVVR